MITSKSIVSRRSVVFAGAAAELVHTLPRLSLAADKAGDSSDIVKSVEHSIVWRAGEKGATWFHPRPCLVPGQRPTVLMTLQPISGSDV